MTTAEKGNQSLIQAMAAFSSAGYLVSIPIGDGCVYDLLVDDKKKIQRVQVKSGKLLSNGAIYAGLRSNNGRWFRKGASRNYRGLADLFCIYCPSTGKCYSLPVADAGTSTLYLRVKASSNRQDKKIRWAKNYEVKPIVEW